MKSRCSLRYLVLSLFLAASLAGFLWAESASVSNWPLSSGKQEKPVLKIFNEAGKQTDISAATFGKLPRQTVKAKDHTGVLGTYDGVAMVELLRAAITTLGKGLKGPLLGNCVLVEAADNFRVVFSLAEIDPELTDAVVLVADRKEGIAFDDKEGPYRLVVPGDKRQMRWVKQVTQISVRPAGEFVAAKKEK